MCWARKAISANRESMTIPNFFSAPTLEPVLTPYPTGMYSGTFLNLIYERCPFIRISYKFVYVSPYLIVR